MAVGRGGPVDGALEIEHGDEALRAQIEVLADQRGDGGIVHRARAEGVDGDGGRFGDPNGVGDLDLTALRQSRCHDVLCHVAPRVSGAPVHLGGILAGESAAAVACHAAVGVHNDLPPREAAVAHGPTDHKVSRGVDVDLGLRRHPFRGHHGLDDLFHHRFPKVFQADSGIVLSRKDDGVHALGPALSVIGEAQLAFRVWAQPGQGAVLPHFRLPRDEAMAVGDGRRHEHVRLVRGIAEHQPLVPGPLLVVRGFVHAHSDIRRLSADGVDDGAGLCVEAHLAGGVADLGDGATDDALIVHRAPRGQADFPASTTMPVFTSVSTATRASGEMRSISSKMASEIWSAILSGWPSLTDSEVNSWYSAMDSPLNGCAYPVLVPVGGPPAAQGQIVEGHPMQGASWSP